MLEQILTVSCRQTLPFLVSPCAVSALAAALIGCGTSLGGRDRGTTPSPDDSWLAGATLHFLGALQL